jgi:hypothetical protein
MQSSGLSITKSPELMALAAMVFTSSVLVAGRWLFHEPVGQLEPTEEILTVRVALALILTQLAVEAVWSHQVMLPLPVLQLPASQLLLPSKLVAPAVPVPKPVANISP